MPNVSPRDYLPRIDQFKEHWELVDRTSGEKIVLTGNYGLRNLLEDREGLVQLLNQVNGIEVLVGNAISERNRLRQNIGERQRQFNAFVRAVCPDPVLVEKLVRVPVPTSGPSVWESVMEELDAIWDEVDSKIQVSLANGYGRADFQQERTELLRTFDAMSEASTDYRVAAEKRDEHWNAIYQRLRQYRMLIQAKFDSNSAVAESLPKLIKTYRRVTTEG